MIQNSVTNEIPRAIDHILPRAELKVLHNSSEAILIRETQQAVGGNKRKSVNQKLIQDTLKKLIESKKQ